jgi:hypothetical protein
LAQQFDLVWSYTMIDIGRLKNLKTLVLE